MKINLKLKPEYAEEIADMAKDHTDALAHLTASVYNAAVDRVTIGLGLALIGSVCIAKIITKIRG